MVRLSVNINKIATLRNARGGAVPDPVEAALKLQSWGAEGITVHPRPDERHIRYADVRRLRPQLQCEFNIEGYPSEDFIALCRETRPDQITLVPDPPGVLTSNAGWNALERQAELTEAIAQLLETGARISLFLDPDPTQMEAALSAGADRIELYTEAYATGYGLDPEHAIAPYVHAAHAALDCGLGLNAGHDLNLDNLGFFAREVPGLLEVSIGHALIADALYYGLENTLRMYRRRLDDAHHDSLHP
ncbi:pyridoxine 5'-phosphate synthase [bacterium]|nr:pyridoxine 5'-phosphate synthase [bacterium]